ncbi:MAG: Mu transposase C-terminal domain-containing protein [Deltaproteobacteria bacterium]|nr:Mu transposase C-terminal domain-containing protein [Deltaproteobacteria bacterium]
MILSLRKGNKVSYKNEIYEVLNPTDLENVLCKNIKTGDISKLPVKELSSPDAETAGNKTPLESYSKKDWEEAEKRLAIIKPLLGTAPTKKQVADRAEEFGTSFVTLYRWINRYLSTGSLSSLVPGYKERGGKGKTRLDEETEKIVKSFIDNEYLTKQKLPASKIIENIKIYFKQADMVAPSDNTIRNRIKALNYGRTLRLRNGKSEYLSKFNPVSDSFNADFPLEIVQIDHTPLDIMVVDEIMRKPIGRPYITIALDIFSRMVYGFYVTLQDPSFFSAGQALYMGIMPKNNYLESLGVEGSWSIYGIPKSMTIHLDNAAEFRGEGLKRFCQEFNIGIDFRPRGAPYYGGHIERVVKTMNMRIHTLSGTTFSNPKERGEYDSEAKAVFTLKELEKWIAEFIVNVYHKSIHSELNMTPEKKYETGILGDDKTAGTGLPDIIGREEAERIRISLLPIAERSVQKDGISFENIKYYSDVLRKYISIKDNNGRKRKIFTIRFDPRDISTIYFYDQDLKMYFPIPYRNMGNPCVSIWDIREAKRYLKKEGLKDYDETRLFQAIKKLNRLEAESFEKTKTARRKLSSNNHHKEKMKLEIESQLKLEPAYNKNTEKLSAGDDTKTENVSQKPLKKTGSDKYKDEQSDETEVFEIDNYDDDL